MNTENSKTSESHQFKKDLTDKLNAKDPKKNIKSEYNNNKLKILAPTWDDTSDLSDESYSIADIQDYFELIIKKYDSKSTSSNLSKYNQK